MPLEDPLSASALTSSAPVHTTLQPAIGCAQGEKFLQLLHPAVPMPEQQRWAMQQGSLQFVEGQLVLYDHGCTPPDRGVEVDSLLPTCG